jgi:hypothetical protein
MPLSAGAVQELGMIVSSPSQAVIHVGGRIFGHLDHAVKFLSSRTPIDTRRSGKTIQRRGSIETARTRVAFSGPNQHASDGAFRRRPPALKPP